MLKAKKMSSGLPGRLMKPYAGLSLTTTPVCRSV